MHQMICTIHTKKNIRKARAFLKYFSIRIHGKIVYWDYHTMHVCVNFSFGLLKQLSALQQPFFGRLFLLTKVHYVKTFCHLEIGNPKFIEQASFPLTIFDLPQKNINSVPILRRSSFFIR